MRLSLLRGSSYLSRCAALSLLGGLAAGCSADFSRVAGSPTPPGSVGGYSAPTGAIPSASSSPVRPVQMAALPPTSAPTSVPMRSQPSEPTFVGSQATGWSADGGSRITASAGDTIETYASRFGVPSAAIRHANGLPASGQPQPGQSVVIPVYRYADGGAAVTPTQSSAQAPRSQQATGGSHVVAPGETVYSMGRQYGVSPHAIIAANNLSSPNHIRVGQRLTIPGGTGSMTASAPAAAPTPTQTAMTQTAAPAVGAAPAATPQLAQAPTQGSAIQPAAYVPPASEPTRRAEPQAGPLPEPGDRAASNFRWPVQGRMIAGFGETTNGQRNDGINLSVPEGTPVKAAENGVVVYAGNELKGFGNLVLVRHADDWVTAYAHNSELSVSRGDQVRRGEIIAKAGKTGNVTSPQVHFEIRRGSTPVDPMKHLSGA